MSLHTRFHKANTTFVKIFVFSFVETVINVLIYCHDYFKNSMASLWFASHHANVFMSTELKSDSKILKGRIVKQLFLLLFLRQLAAN